MLGLTTEPTPHALYLLTLGDKRNPAVYDAAGFWVKMWLERLIAQRFDGMVARENILRMSGAVNFNAVQLFLASPGLFHPHRLAILDHAEWPKKEETLQRYWQDPPPEATLVVIEDRVSPGLEQRLPKTAVLSTKGLGPRDFEKLVTAEAELRGIRFSPEGKAYFLTVLDGNGWQMGPELEKLALIQNTWPKPGSWDIRHLEPVLAEPLAEDGSYFKVTDAFLDRNRRQCLRLIHQALVDGAEPVLLFVIVVRQLIRLGHALAVEGVIRPEEFARREGMKPYPAQKLLRARKGWQAHEVSQALSLAVVVDRVMKQGGGDSATWLETFIAVVV